MNHEFNNIGQEPKKTWIDKDNGGFFDKYMSGLGVDVGYKGGRENACTVLLTAKGIDIGSPGYDGINLPFASESQDYVYSSHCLEHVLKPFDCLREWLRVVKVGGFVIIVVPHQYLYEKKSNMPSRFSREHLRFYTPAKLLEHVEAALPPNSYRVKFLEDGDTDFDYNLPPETHSTGQYEITLVLQKINPPYWKVE